MTIVLNEAMSEANVQEFKNTYQIKEHHLDTYGHVNHATYLQILEEVRWDIITAKGYGLNRVAETGVGPTILNVNITYRRELVNRETITIVTRFLAFERKIATIQQQILKESGELASEVEIKLGLFDTKTRKLVEPTAEWRNSVGV